MLNLKISNTTIEDVKVIEPKVFKDSRGYFYESFNQKKFNEAIGHNVSFVQDNQSSSTQGTLRGLHMQTKPYSQGKLVRVISGQVFDVAVDLRPESKTFGKSVSVILDSNLHNQLWIPEGFAHGFLVLSDEATFVYKTTSFYEPSSEITLKFDDPDLNIDWPKINCDLNLSEKDKSGISFKIYCDKY